MKSDTYYQNERPEIAPLVPSNAKHILEIGCAEGRFRRNFSADIEYWGVEPCVSAADKAQKNGIKVFCGFYDTVENKIPNDYFDVVVCNDVIEHIFDTSTFLISIKNKLRRDGVLVGSIPNVRFWGNLVNLLIHRDWHYEDGGVLDRTHVRFFTKKSFLTTVSASGFDVESFFGIETKRMKILKILFGWILCFLGFDICDMQFAFRLKVK